MDYATESSADLLSQDILSEVFEFLDGKTLKTSALVCAKWNELIGSSPRTMKKFKFKLYSDESDFFLI